MKICVIDVLAVLEPRLQKHPLGVPWICNRQGHQALTAVDSAHGMALGHQTHIQASKTALVGHGALVIMLCRPLLL